MAGRRAPAVGCGPVTQPLSGIKVLDFSEHGFVPSAAAALADWGADVIKLERPEGDPDARDHQPGSRRRRRRVRLPVPIGQPEQARRLDRCARTQRDARYSSAWCAGPTCTSPTSCPGSAASCIPSPRTSSPSILDSSFARGHGQGQRGEGAEQGGFDAVSFWSRGGIGPHAHRPQLRISARPGLRSAMCPAGCSWPAGSVPLSSMPSGRGRGSWSTPPSEWGQLDPQPRPCLRVDDRRRTPETIRHTRGPISAGLDLSHR